MRASFLIFFLFLFFFHFSFSQAPDSIVRFSEVTFNSDFEREYFTRLIQENDKENLLPLFLGCDETSTAASLLSAENKMKHIYSILDKEGIDKKSEAKKIKTIYKTVHSSFLKKYEFENNFTDIFKNGNYNCLSATALYSLFLEKYKIPYTIKETPNHVFLIAYPETLKILIETTNPVSGYFQYSDAFIEKYVEDLKKAKLISESEYISSSKSDLFNKYFFKNEDINLKQLVGLQYYNLSLYKSSKEKYKEGFQDLQKAYLLYPSEGIKYLLKNTLLMLLSKSDYDKTEEIQYYIYISRFIHDNNEIINTNILSDEFSRITNKQLIDKSNFDLYKRTYALVSKNITDTVLKKEIDYIYNYEYARAILHAEKDEDIRPNLQIIYALHPDNINVQSIIGAYVTNKIIPLNNPQLILKELEVYIKDYYFLGKNNKIARVFSSCYLEIAAQNFAQNEVKKGEEHLQKFEEFIKDKDKSVVMEVYIEKCYSLAAASYYKRGNYDKAKAILKQGLEYAPGNYHLMSRLNSID